MKTHWKVILAGLFGALAGGAIGWMGRDLQLRQAGRETEDSSLAARVVLLDIGSSNKAGKTETSARRQPSPSLRETIKQATSGVVVGSGVRKFFTTEQFDDYLQRHQRDAGSLLTVYRITKDEALLREAWEKNPDHPQIAAHVLEALKLPVEEKLTLLEKVRQAHPNEALTDILACGTLVTEGRMDEALRFLQEGLAKPGLVLKWKEQALDAREALISADKSPTEARVLSSLYSFTIPPEIIGIATQGSAQVKQLLQNGREDEALTLAGQLLGLGNRLEGNFGQTSMAEVIGHLFKERTLDALPKDVEIGDTGKTAEEMFELNQEEISAFTSETSDLNNKMEWHLQNLDDVGVELFYQIFEERGYRAALEWVEVYHGPAPANGR